MTRFYIYLHCKPNGDPFYVGKGCDKWYRRSHQLKYGRNRFHKNTVAKYGAENIEIFVFFCDSEQQALLDEAQHIAQLRSDGYALVNLTDGGEGMSGFRHSEEAKKKAGARQKNIWTGRKHSEETRKKMSESRRGNKNAVGGKGPLGTKRTDEFRARMSEIAKGRTFSEETRLKMSQAQKRRNAIAAQSGVEPVYKSAPPIYRSSES